MSSTGKHLLALSIVVAGLLTGPALADTPPRLEPLDGPTASIYGPFSYDPSGNIIAIGSTPGSYYVYDPMSRVIGAVVQRGTAVQTQSYAYDVYGNRTAVGGSGGGTYSVNSATNQLTSHGAQYDAAGNLITCHPPNSVHARQYSYDAGGMLTREHAPTASAVSSVMHVYTASEERYWRFETLSDGANVSHYTIRNLEGRVLRDYLETSWGGFSLEGDYVYREGLLLAFIKSSATHHYSLDHLGTPRIVTDQSGTRIAEHTYYPFGTEITDGSPTDGPLKFTGHERSPDVLGETSATLDYMHARFYGANMGRFLSVDPMLDVEAAMQNPQLWNRYSYVANNPINAVDPTGRLLVRLGQHTDEEIRKRQAEIKKELKSRDLTKEQRAALKAERDMLKWEAKGNKAVAKMLTALEKAGQRNGLILNDFTLSTDTAADFPGATQADVAKMMQKDAFVLQGPSQLTGTIYVRTEPATGIYNLSFKGNDYVMYGGATLRHEQVHLFGNRSEFVAYSTQRAVFQLFQGMFRDRSLYQYFDQWLAGQIAANPR